MVVRRSPLRALAGVATGLVLAAGLVPPAPAAADDPARSAGSPVSTAGTAPGPTAEDDTAPLQISIDRMTPGVLPTTGPIVLTGTVTNTDLDDWHNINLYPLFGDGPGCTLCVPAITTAEGLAAAAATDPASPVGERDVAIVSAIPTLAPGESATYTLRIPQPVLRTHFGDRTPGVYWFGVHASGESPGTPRDDLADGRARTFLPIAPEGAGVVDTAIVVPLRGRIAHLPDGSMSRPDQWERSLSVDGDLGGPLAFGAASAGAPMTWLVDPAVPDAIKHLADGNPARQVSPLPDPDAPAPSQSASSDEDGTDEPEPTVPETALTRSARSWLARAAVLLRGDTVAALPHGDLDVAAAADAEPSLYRSAREQPGSLLDAWDEDAIDVVAPPDGFLDGGGLGAIDDKAAVLVGDQAFPEDSFRTGPPDDALVNDTPLVVTSPGAATGGPGPDDPQAPVALRQRILSEVVVRLLDTPRADPTPDPLVVVLPSSVTATGAADFWAGLDTDWLRLVALPDLITPASDAADPGRQVLPDELAYPRAAEQRQLDARVLTAAGELVRAARSLQALLGERYTIGDELVAEALTGSSYAMRGESGAAERLARTRRWVEDQLELVTIDAPSGVTLSGASGTFNVAVRNELDHPVTVRIEATTDAGATLESPESILLAPHSRASVPITAGTTRPGVHNVTLRLTDPDGDPIGGEDTLPLRSAQVGIVIWVIIGTGGAILFVAIGIRLLRRVRNRGGADDEPSTPVTAS